MAITISPTTTPTIVDQINFQGKNYQVLSKSDSNIATLNYTAIPGVPGKQICALGFKIKMAPARSVVLSDGVTSLFQTGSLTASVLYAWDYKNDGFNVSTAVGNGLIIQTSATGFTYTSNILYILL